MSVYYTAGVWELADAEGTKLLMLIALADYCNDDGICWPSNPHLAERCRLSVRQTQRLLSEICSDQLATPNGPAVSWLPGTGKGRGNKRVLQMSPFFNKKGDIQGRKKVTSRALKGDIQGKPPFVPSYSVNHQEPSLNTEPSKERQSLPDLKHPAIIAYRDEALLTPSISVRKTIIEKVGDKHIFWREVVHHYLLTYQNPRNVKGMLDFFERGELPGEYKGNSRSTSKTARNMQLLKEVMEDRERGETE